MKFTQQSTNHSKQYASYRIIEKQLLNVSNQETPFIILHLFLTISSSDKSPKVRRRTAMRDDLLFGEKGLSNQVST